MIVRLHADDNIAVAIDDIVAGQLLPALGIVAAQAIPRGHKIAIRAIADGDWVLRYAQAIGAAKADISVGQHVHSHNLVMADVPRSEHLPSQAFTDKAPDASFLGYWRDDLRLAGTRNYVAVVPMVSCAVTVARRITQNIQQRIVQSYPGIDGAMALSHASGCAMDSNGIGLKTLQRTLAGWVGNPNFAGVLLVGLGCETNQIASFLSAHGLSVGERLQTLSIQQAGGTQAAIDQGIAQLETCLPQWSAWQRTRLNAAHLRVALQCGGSDGFSGVSANPALGCAADKLVAAGAAVILAETPEIYGAEQLLKQRAINDGVAATLQSKIDWWRDYVAREGGTLDHNPSPGNKAGGLTTILEKSLGAVAKAGVSPLQAVLEYGERNHARGLLFMDSPGYDPVSITGQIAAGANIVCFTTGRGSTYGSKPVPTLKLASNSLMAQRMSSDMDIDCGPILAGVSSHVEMGDQIFDRILALASGAASKSEQLDLGDDAFVPWQLGAVL